MTADTSDVQEVHAPSRGLYWRAVAVLASGALVGLGTLALVRGLHL